MKRDANEKGIVDALRKCGATVERIYSSQAGCPDLCVGIDGRNLLVEVKMPKLGRLSDAQKAWRDEWRGGKPFCMKTTDDVVMFIKLIKTLDTKL
jgi:hypothetical protein